MPFEGDLLVQKRSGRNKAQGATHGGTTIVNNTWTPFLGTELGPLKKLLGSENVMLDMWNQKLTIRGSLAGLSSGTTVLQESPNASPYTRNRILSSLFWPSRASYTLILRTHVLSRVFGKLPPCFQGSSIVWATKQDVRWVFRFPVRLRIYFP